MLALTVEEQMWAILDAGPADLIRLVVALAEKLNVYDLDAGEYDGHRKMYYDMPGGAGLVDLSTVLDEHDLATLREVLDTNVDVRRRPLAPPGVEDQ